MMWRPLAGVIARAGSSPDDVALTDADGTLTWGEVLAAGRALRPTPAPLPAARDGSWRHVLVRLVAVATHGGVLAVPDESWPAAVRVLAAADVAQSPVAADLLVWTSGSTGRPRPVRRTAASWDASVDLVSDLAGIGADDAVLLTGPPSSTLQLYAAWHALSVGARLIAPDADHAARRSATALHGVPTVVADVVADARWPSMRTVVVAGADVPAELRRAVIARGWRWTAYYGAAELSFVAADVGTGLRACRDVEVRLREPASEAPDGSRTGVLEVRSPYLALDAGSTDALSPRALSARALSTRALVTDGGDWRTAGDVVTLRSDGSLVVLGRGNAAVTTGGHTVVVEGVEAVMRTWSGVDDVAVVGTAHPRLGEVVTAVVVGVRTRAELEALSRRHLPAPSRPRQWWTTEQLPHTSGGKLDRAAVRNAVRAVLDNDPVDGPGLVLHSLR